LQPIKLSNQKSPFSSILFNKEFVKKYQEFLSITDFNPDYFQIREFVINYIFIWNDIRGPGHLNTINKIIKILTLKELPDIKKSKIRDHVIEYDFTYYYIVEYISKILEKYTNFEERKFDLLAYFNNIFLKNIDIWGFTMIYITFVENLYNTKLDLVLGPGGVPFMFHTATVQELVNSIDNFVEFFQTNVKYPNLVTEFHLYSGYVLHKFGSYEMLYNKTQYYQVVNIADYEATAFDVLFNTMSSKYNILTVSIHRRTYKDLSDSQIVQWIGFLKDKSVIHDELETRRQINTYT